MHAICCKCQVTVTGQLERRHLQKVLHDLLTQPYSASITFFLLQENNRLLHGSGYMKNFQGHIHVVGATVHSLTMP